MIAKFLRKCLYFEVATQFIGEPIGGLQLHRTFTVAVFGRFFSFGIMLVANKWYDSEFI